MLYYSKIYVCMFVVLKSYTSKGKTDAILHYMYNHSALFSKENIALWFENRALLPIRENRALWTIVMTDLEY